MESLQNYSTRASALQITLSVALISVSAILLAIAAPTNTKEASRQNPLGVQPDGVAPTLSTTDSRVASLPPFAKNEH